MKRRERERQAEEARGGSRLARELYGPPGARYNPHGHVECRIRLFREGEPIGDTWALIDTGAVYSIFPSSLMAPLGISRADCVTDPVTMVGASGTVLTARKVIEAECRGRRVSLLGSFSPTIKRVILGTEDFLQNYVLTVHLREGTIGLEPSELPPRERVKPPPGGSIVLPPVEGEPQP